MADKISWKARMAGYTAAKGITAWMRTLEYRVIYHDQAIDPCYPTEQNRIYLLWHEYLLIPLYLRGRCNLAMLLSKHQDGELLSRVAFHFGYDCVRGSTNRGGVAALKELLRRGKTMHLTITPDGPRGPRRRLSLGSIYLASRLNLPIVPIGFGLDRPWRLNSWDRFAIPKPFSQARAVVGPEMAVPAGFDRVHLEDYRVAVERVLYQVNEQAETWATSGEHREGEVHSKRRALDLRATTGDAVFPPQSPPSCEEPSQHRLSA